LANRILLILFISASLLFFGCKEERSKDNIGVFVSILPQKYFVSKIAGDRVKVEVLVLPGKNPATYEPSPRQTISLAKAKVLFTVGVPFEKAFLPKIENTLKSLKIIDTSVGIKKRTLEADVHNDEESLEENGEEHNHIAQIRDPHIWMSPSLVKIQAKNIYDALIDIDPDGKSEYEKGYLALIKEIENLIIELRETLKPFWGSPLFVFHPAFGYFADEFGLKQIAFETGGKEPTPAKLTEIIESAKKEGAKIIFVQPEFSQESAKKIAKAINGSVVSLNPLEPNYIDNLKLISLEIEKSYR